MKMKGSLDAYIKALEEEIERVKHQRACIPEFRSESCKSWDEYLKALEDRRVEACLLMDFEEDEVDER